MSFTSRVDNGTQLFLSFKLQLSVIGIVCVYITQIVFEHEAMIKSHRKISVYNIKMWEGGSRSQGVAGRHMSRWQVRCCSWFRNPQAKGRNEERWQRGCSVQSGVGCNSLRVEGQCGGGGWRSGLWRTFRWIKKKKLIEAWEINLGKEFDCLSLQVRDWNGGVVRHGLKLHQVPHYQCHLRIFGEHLFLISDASLIILQTMCR